jgi:hypothetical protein
MLGRGNEIVITVDLVREEAKQRQEEVLAAAKNDGSGLREWIIEEAAWPIAQFAKVAMSVAVVRGVHQLFRGGYASESAYQRAPDLWSHGHRQQDHRSTYTRPSGSTGTWRPGGGSTSGSAQGDGFDQGADHAASDGPRYVITVEGYHLYLHRKILNPGKQFWPCPLLYVSPCETCAFLEYDGGGRPQCVALVKLRTVLDGTNAGEDLSEIRQWIRSS